MRKILLSSLLLSFLACKEAPKDTTTTLPAKAAEGLAASSKESTDSGGSLGDAEMESRPISGKEERIEIDKTGASLVWEQEVAGKSSKDFVFAARAGQLLMLGFTDDTNIGTMDFGKVSVEPNGDGIEYTIEITKDYRFTVTNNSSKSTSFRIYLTVDNPASATAEQKMAPQAGAAQKETVQFAKGESSVALTRTIAASGSIDFMINVKKGNRMSFTIGYDMADADIQGFVTEPGSQDIALSTGPKSPNEFPVTVNGIHRLTVNNTTKKKATITLYLDVE
ncbi:MAG: hypothetical protein EAY75_10320 [Bacteroidetes bacterium]|nr:MAG: hypothetical protein EAY75_10320 [Bacteroidota bacterium]